MVRERRSKSATISTAATSAPALPVQAAAVTGEEAFIMPLCAVFRIHLRAEKQKFTPERAQILDAVIRMGRVFEADELLYEMRRMGPRVSKATVYRTLKLMQDAGLIEQVFYDQKQAHFRLAYGQPPRDQLICVETGKVVEFSMPEIIELRDRIAAKHGWSPVGHRFQVYGVSPEGAGEAAGEDQKEPAR